MAFHYVDQRTAEDPYHLPDLEVWEDRVVEVTCEKCGVFCQPYDTVFATSTVYCPSCEGVIDSKPVDTRNSGWFYWYSLPGCMPSSDLFGPFMTEEEALEDARKDYEDFEED
jgi:hypothetical protein